MTAQEYAVRTGPRVPGCTPYISTSIAPIASALGRRARSLQIPSKTSAAPAKSARPQSNAQSAPRWRTHGARPARQLASATAARMPQAIASNRASVPRIACQESASVAAYARIEVEVMTAATPVQPRARIDHPRATKRSQRAPKTR